MPYNKEWCEMLPSGHDVAIAYMIKSGNTLRMELVGAPETPLLDEELRAVDECRGVEKYFYLGVWSLVAFPNLS